MAARLALLHQIQSGEVHLSNPELLQQIRDYCQQMLQQTRRRKLNSQPQVFYIDITKIYLNFFDFFVILIYANNTKKRTGNAVVQAIMLCP